MRTFKAIAISSLVAVLGGSCDLVFAQIVSQPILSMPPDKFTVDQNSVDVRTGTFSLSKTQLSIGDQAHGLTLTQSYSSGSGWRDSFTGVLRVQSSGPSNQVHSVTASWGMQSWSFDSLAGPSISGDGTTLSTPKVYRRDGTIIEYTDIAGPYTCAGDGSPCDYYYYPTAVKSPNGLVLTLHYRVVDPLHVRVQSVTNNAGYQIKFTYQTDNPTQIGWLTRTKATAINNAVEYCDPIADTCAVSSTWPSVSYVSTTSGHTVTDALNRSTVYTYNYNTGYFGIKTPTAPTDNIRYTWTTYLEMATGSTIWRTTSAAMGSSTWNYSYTDNTTTHIRTITTTDPLSHSIIATSEGPEVTEGWILNSVSDQLGRLWQVSMCPLGETSVIFPEGNVRTITCDRGNVISTTLQPKANSGLGNFGTSATYPDPLPLSPGECLNFITCNLPVSTRDGKGAQTDYEYYPNHGGVKTVTLPAVNGVRAQKRYEYTQFYAYVKNSSGSLVTAATPIWLPTRVAECRKSNYSTTTNSCVDGAADEVVTTFEYAGAGTVNRTLLRGQVVTSEGVSLRTCYAYDAIGNQISVTSPRAALSSCPDAAPTGATAFTKSSRYDAGRQLVGTISPLAEGVYQAVRNTYNAEGQIVTVERGYLTTWQSDATLPAAWSSFTAREFTQRTYDTLSRLLTERRSSSTTPDKTLTQYSYDAVGRKDCVALRMNPALYSSGPPYSLPASACTLGTQGVNGPDRITHFDYDAAGQLLTEQRANGTPLQQNYAHCAYTLNGRQDWVEDSNGNRTDFSYDGVDRLQYMYFPSTTVGAHAANANDYELYGYDENHNRTSLRLRSGETISYVFDALNRVYFKDLPAASVDVYSGFDLQGHLLYSRFGSNALTAVGVTNVFDGFGRLTSTTSVSTVDTRVLSFLYDEDGNRTRITWPDSNFVQYTYDGLDRMNQVRENGATSGTGLLAVYSYDVLGRRAGITRGNSSTAAYGYDGISRLSSLGQSRASAPWSVGYGFSYNEASQIIHRTLDNDAYAYLSTPESKSYTPDGLNRYSSVAGVSFGYDLRGNLTSDGSRSFTYDYENHLLTVSAPSSMSLSYDPMGRLMTTQSGGVTTRYLYAGDDLVAEYTGGTLARRYVPGAGVDEPLVWYEGATLTDRRWLHANHQGSVIAFSNAAGDATPYAYGTYGEPANANWSGSRFRYTGQIALPEAKLYHYKARVYDPVLGRFLQTDPVGYADDINLYAYVGNDPLDRTDPSGTEGVGCWNNGKDCAGTVEGIAARAAYVGVKSDQTRADYENKTSKLDPSDSAGRTSAKAEARANTPREVRAVVEAKRPGLGAKEGSGGTANRTNVAANEGARTLGKIGRAAGVASVVAGGVEIATADNKVRATTAVAGGVGGGVLGGEIGAAIGGLGGPAAPVTVALGGVIGSAVGGYFGHDAGEKVYDSVDP